MICVAEARHPGNKVAQNYTSESVSDDSSDTNRRETWETDQEVRRRNGANQSDNSDSGVYADDSIAPPKVTASGW